MSGQGSGRRREVVEYNPSPRWPQGYFQVLEEMGVGERRRGFYAHWVRQFFNRSKGRRRRRDLGRSDIDRFLGILRDGGGVEDWQVEQAQEALEIYYEQFRGIALDGEPTPLADAAKAPEPPPTPGCNPAKTGKQADRPSPQLPPEAIATRRAGRSEAGRTQASGQNAHATGSGDQRVNRTVNPTAQALRPVPKPRVVSPFDTL